MRIVAGSLRGRRIEAPSTIVTRPTGDRVRESLFNVLENIFERRDIPYEELTFLDAFSGSGALGIEALSRGAKAASFIEQNNRAYSTIKDNLGRLGLEEKTKTYRRDVLRPGAPHHQHDVVLLDPPYGKDLASKALKSLARHGWLTENCLVAVERGEKEPTFDLDGFAFLDSRIYGITQILFFAREPVNQEG